ncbi:MAG: HU family DNA-binding protein [bacterium]
MTKAELVDAIAKSSKLTKADSEKALSATISAVIGALKKGDAVRLVGFGTFEVTKRAARKGRNPQTGKEIQIKASKSPKFKAGKSFKEAVNTGK